MAEPNLPRLKLKFYAPFSPEQVAGLNSLRYSVHSPYRCGSLSSSNDAHKHHAKTELAILDGLVAAPGGLICPVCGWSQDWAYAWKFSAELTSREMTTQKERPF